ncbi:low temperature requirement protein A [Janthinobacterium sp. MDB2-8]|uniref:low temperature requirement protein A n=1 Tax=Janthinobacterium sp. MDB2-8 TaxID=1259338 RepID=UPI003F23548A
MSGASQTPSHPLLRHRDGHHARVTYEELFFDLVYVFAVTQLSHKLLTSLTLVGAIETLILWFAVWLGWQYTCWVTNWFDPETPRIRGMIFATMLLGLVMAASIPLAFSDRGLIFACAYATMQVGRTAFIALQLPVGHPLALNYRRMLGWVSIAAVFWIAGALARDETRALLWLAAVLCEYISPMFGFALPGLGRSRTQEWTIEGGHLTERCQLFVIVALGETVLASGATLSSTDIWTPAVLQALLSTFVGILAMWWLYFGTSSKDAMAAITHSKDPGRIGAYFHYIHAILIAGVIVTAVGNDLVLAHPYAQPTFSQIVVLLSGPAIYLLGSAIYKKIVYGVLPRSHMAGVLILLALLPVAFAANMSLIGWLTTVTLLVVNFWDMYLLRGRQRKEQT